MAKTQMNVRVDENDKRLGDEAFDNAGYNPTQVVGAVWGFAANNRHDPKRVRKFIEDCKQGASDGEAQRRQRATAAIERHRQLMEEFEAMMRTQGADPGFTPQDPTNEELHERAFEERAHEKGGA